MRLTSRERAVRLFCAIAAIGIAASSSGCIVAGSYIAHRVLTNKGETVKVQINENADVVYESLVAETKESDPETLKIINDRPAKRKFEAKRTGADGAKTWFEWQVKALTETTSELTVSASIKKHPKEEVVKLIEDRLAAFCDANGYEWEKLN